MKAPFTARHRQLGCWALASSATTTSKTSNHLFYSILLWARAYSWLSVWTHWASDHALCARLLRITSLVSASSVCLIIIHQMHDTHKHSYFIFIENFFFAIKNATSCAIFYFHSAMLSCPDPIQGPPTYQLFCYLWKAKEIGNCSQLKILHL